MFGGRSQGASRCGAGWEHESPPVPVDSRTCQVKRGGGVCILKRASEECVHVDLYPP